jgi:hypothetical protein
LQVALEVLERRLDFDELNVEPPVQARLDKNPDAMRVRRSTVVAAVMATGPVI